MDYKPVYLLGTPEEQSTTAGPMGFHSENKLKKYTEKTG